MLFLVTFHIADVKHMIIMRYPLCCVCYVVYNVLRTKKTCWQSNNGSRWTEKANVKRQMPYHLCNEFSVYNKQRSIYVTYICCAVYPLIHFRLPTLCLLRFYCEPAHTHHDMTSSISIAPCLTAATEWVKRKGRWPRRDTATNIERTTESILWQCVLLLFVYNELAILFCRSHHLKTCVFNRLQISFFFSVFWNQLSLLIAKYLQKIADMRVKKYI